MSIKTKSVVYCENGHARIGRKDWRRQMPEHIVRKEVDAAPYEVATAMLCAPKARSTNRERKVGQAARANHYVSDRESRPLEEKAAGRLKQANWAQLAKWHARAVARRALTQHAFQACQRMLTKAQAALEKETDKARKEELQGAIFLLTRRTSSLDLTAMTQLPSSRGFEAKDFVGF